MVILLEFSLRTDFLNSSQSKQHAHQIDRLTRELPPSRGSCQQVTSANGRPVTSNVITAGNTIGRDSAHVVVGILVRFCLPLPLPQDWARFWTPSERKGLERKEEAQPLELFMLCHHGTEEEGQSKRPAIHYPRKTATGIQRSHTILPPTT